MTKSDIFIGPVRRGDAVPPFHGEIDVAKMIATNARERLADAGPIGPGPT